MAAALICIVLSLTMMPLPAISELSSDDDGLDGGIPIAAPPPPEQRDHRPCLCSRRRRARTSCYDRWLVEPGLSEQRRQMDTFTKLHKVDQDTVAAPAMMICVDNLRGAVAMKQKHYPSHT